MITPTTVHGDSAFCKHADPSKSSKRKLEEKHPPSAQEFSLLESVYKCPDRASHCKSMPVNGTSEKLKINIILNVMVFLRTYLRFNLIFQAYKSKNSFKTFPFVVLVNIFLSPIICSHQMWLELICISGRNSEVSIVLAVRHPQQNRRALLWKHFFMG